MEKTQDDFRDKKVHEENRIEREENQDQKETFEIRQSKIQKDLDFNELPIFSILYDPVASVNHRTADQGRTVIIRESKAFRILVCFFSF